MVCGSNDRIHAVFPPCELPNDLKTTQSPNFYSNRLSSHSEHLHQSSNVVPNLENRPIENDYYEDELAYWFLPDCKTPPEGWKFEHPDYPIILSPFQPIYKSFEVSYPYDPTVKKEDVDWETILQYCEMQLPDMFSSEDENGFETDHSANEETEEYVEADQNKIAESDVSYISLFFAPWLTRMLTYLREYVQKNTLNRNFQTLKQIR